MRMVRMLVVPDALVKVRQTGTLNLIEFLKLLPEWLKLEFRQVLMQVQRDVPACLADYGIPAVTVKVLRVRQLRQDQLLLQSRHQIQNYSSPPLYADPNLSNNSAFMKSVPAVFYGTAWKKERTAQLVELALRKGFRGVDTACQPKHYNQRGVGEGVARSKIPRDQVFLQTKYTPFNGQDPNNIPYDPKDSLQVQVQTSLQVSLKNLQTEYLDSLVLHSPMSNLQKTMQVWRKFEQFVSQGKVKYLGISNCYSLPFFQQLYAAAKVKPSFLQNRFYADSNYDRILREFCKANDVQYQSFWTLTANPHVLKEHAFKTLAQKYKFTPEQLFYTTLIQEGIIPLIGTCNEQHMEQDLAVVGAKVEEADIKTIMGMLK